MAGKTQVELELIALTKQAQADVKKFAEDSNKQLAGINMATTFTAILEGFEVAKGALDGVIGFFEKCSHEASKSEDAISLLNNSMRITGEYSEFASERMQKFAEQVASASIYSDDAVISSLALAKSFGLTNLEARKLSSAAADLAAFTGKDLNSATQELAATYNGFVSKTLVHMVPQLKSLTVAQLESGKAVDYLAERLKGSAADALNSFSGQLRQNEKEIEDFQKAIGKHTNIIVGHWLRWAREGASALASFGAIIKRDSLSYEVDVNNMFEGMSKKIREVHQRNLDDEKDRRATDKARRDRANADAAIAAKEELETFKRSFVDKKKEIQLRSLSEQGRIEQEFQNDSLIIARAYGIGLIKDSKVYLDILYGLKKEQLRKEQELQNKVRAEDEAAEAKFDKQRKDTYERGVKDPVKQLILFGSKLDKDQAIGVGAGLLSAITKGAEGARGLLAKGLGSAISEALGAGEALSGPIADMVTLLSQGPEKTKQMVTEFVRAIPELIKNLAESLPVLIETLVRELPPALAKAMPQVAIGFTVALVKNMPQIIKGFVEGLIEGAKAFVNAILDLIKSAGGIFGDNGVFGGGNGNGGLISGSGIPIVSDIGDFLGLADGGRIPDRPKYRGDKFKAGKGINLDAGEQILSRQLTEKLDRMADGSGQKQTFVHNTYIGGRQIAQAVYDADKSGFRLRFAR